MNPASGSELSAVTCMVPVTGTLVSTVTWHPLGGRATATGNLPLERAAELQRKRAEEHGVVAIDK